MRAITLEHVRERLELADQLREGRDSMFEPEDLPGRYGGVVRALNHLLAAVDAEAVLGGGWAVWRHGFLGRVTQDVEIVLAAGRARDESDIVELVRANPDHVHSVRRHLEGIHPDYVAHFDHLVRRAREQQDESRGRTDASLRDHPSLFIENLATAA
jgi:hypothetical protein